MFLNDAQGLLSVGAKAFYDWLPEIVTPLTTINTQISLIKRKSGS